MSDEGFHEIQLNGKQLVFLFMAASVVAVVVFLCGVMVGRGVPTRAALATETPEQAVLDPTASLRDQASSPNLAGGGSRPIAESEILKYPDLLENPNPPVETLAPAQPSTESSQVVTPAVRAGSPQPVAAPKPAALPAPRGSVREAEPATPLLEPPGNGFVVQVAAVRERAEANTIARNLSNKGYPAFVTTSGPNFRVRVGKFNDRREADMVAVRLEREERFKPWVTR